MAAIENQLPGLVCQGLNPDGFRFEGDSSGITFGLFYWDKAFIGQTGCANASLVSGAARFWPLVESGLSIQNVNRIGHRTWLCFEMPKRESLAWLSSFQFLTVVGDTETPLGTPDATGAVFRSKLASDRRHLRLEVNGGTLTLGKSEVEGVIIDVDISVEKPDLRAMSSDEFVRWNQRFIDDTIEPFFRGK